MKKIPLPFTYQEGMLSCCGRKDSATSLSLSGLPVPTPKRFIWPNGKPQEVASLV